MQAPIEIPWKRLSPEQLKALAEAFILREGTDYGREELAFAVKLKRLLALIEQREVIITFDTTTESFKVITTESEDIAKDIQIWVDKHIKTQNLEELMRVRDKGAHVNFYVKSTKNDDRVKKLLMFVTDINGDQINLGDRNPETVLLYLSGDIDLTQISKLVNEMNLPGGQQLGKLNEK